MSRIARAAGQQDRFKTEQTAHWLKSPYDAEVWDLVADDRDPRLGIQAFAFNYRLPDGRFLVDPKHRAWLATVKTYSWNLRSGPYASCTTAKTQILLTRNLMHLVSWTMLQGRSSFAELLPSDIQALPAKAAFGAPVLLRYKDRLEEHLLYRKTSGWALPTFTDRDGGVRIDTAKLCEEAELPHSANKFCGKIIHDQAIAAGLSPPSTNVAKDYEEKVRNWVLINDLLSPLQRLWEMSLNVDVDAPTIEPFPEGTSRAARRVGASVGKTKIPPARAYMVLLDRSLRWVIDYSPSILEALHLYRTGEEGHIVSGPSGPGTPWPLATTRYEGQGRLTLDSAVKYLVLACYIVIAAFTARRKTEIIRLERGCISGHRSEGLWLRSYIAKTLREDDLTPCPACVGSAVEVLEALAPAGKLLTWITPFGDERELDPAKHLVDFSRFVNVPADENGRHWPFTSHQLRKMFAVLYVWRWHHGDLESLGHHLRHFDLGMTRRYATTSELGAMIAEQERSYTHTILSEVATGKRAVGGLAGTRLKQLLTRLRKTTEVHGPERLPMLVKRFVDRANIVVKTNPWSYCLCPATPEGSARAKCRQLSPAPGSEGADLAEARPEVCHGCTFNMTDPTFAPFMEREMSALRTSLATEQPTMLRAAMQKRLADLETYLQEDIHTARPI